jgi:glycosyltransferase involved in cell wall biosynthesis
MKGLVPLLEAVAKLRTEREVELVVIGRPTEGGRVARTIDRLGLARSCAARAGSATTSWPSLRRGPGGSGALALRGLLLPAIEAMACGVPLLATTGGALPEVVGTDGETGLLVAPDDPEALAAGIRRIMDDPALARRLGEGAGPGCWAASRGRPRRGGRPTQYRATLADHGRRRATEQPCADGRLRPARCGPR